MDAGANERGVDNAHEPTLPTRRRSPAPPVSLSVKPIFFRRRHVLILPNVKDEPRPERARLVQQNDSGFAVSLQSSGR